MLEYFDSLGNLCLITRHIPILVLRVLSKFNRTLVTLILLLTFFIYCCFLLFYEFSSIDMYVRATVLKVHGSHQATTMRWQMVLML